MMHTLPTPGSVWLHKKTTRLMRAVIVDEEQIIAHNCELAMRDTQIPMASWKGTPEEFSRSFLAAPNASYPKTAK